MKDMLYLVVKLIIVKIRVAALEVKFNRLIASVKGLHRFV